MSGIFQKDYHAGRKKRIDYIYRLNRRTSEVKSAIENNLSDLSNLSCLDIGTADGIMLSSLNKSFKFSKAIGIDMSRELISTNSDESIKLEVGDAQNLRFDDNSFDVIVSCAVIEYLEDPEKMMRECYRVLNPGGIVIVTVPNSWHDKLSSKIGYSSKEEFVQSFTMHRLKELIRSSNLRVVEARYFMFFPFFKIPFEDKIDNIINKIGLGAIMPNQLIAGKK